MLLSNWLVFLGPRYTQQRNCFNLFAQWLPGVDAMILLQLHAIMYKMTCNDIAQ